MRYKFLLSLILIFIFTTITRVNVYGMWCGNNNNCAGTCGSGYCEVTGVCPAGFTNLGACATPGEVLCRPDGVDICNDAPPNNFIYCQCPSVPLPQYDAVCVGHTIPSRLITGNVCPVTVTMRNTGSFTWSEATFFRLGTVNMTNNRLWITPANSTDRVFLSPADLIPTNSQKTFSFNMTAPAPGVYIGSSIANSRPKFRMVRDGITWFGPTCGADSVEVIPRPTCTSVAYESLPYDVATSTATTKFATTEQSSGTIRIWARGVNMSGAGIVYFPTWSGSNGQDDLKNPWVQGTQVGSDWYYDIPVSDHFVAGSQIFTHIYMVPNGIPNSACNAASLVCGTSTINTLAPTSPGAEVKVNDFSTLNFETNRAISVNTGTPVNLVARASSYVPYGIDVLTLWRRPCNAANAQCTNTIGWISVATNSCALGCTNLSLAYQWTPTVADYLATQPNAVAQHQFIVSSTKKPSPIFSHECYGPLGTLSWGGLLRRCDFQGNMVDDLVTVNLAAQFKVTTTVRRIPYNAVGCTDFSAFDPTTTSNISVTAGMTYPNPPVGLGAMSTPTYTTPTTIPGGTSLSTVCVNNLVPPTGSVFTPICYSLNSGPYVLATAVSGCFNFPVGTNITADTTIDIGVKENSAQAWISNIRGDVFAGAGVRNYTIPSAVSGGFGGFLYAKTGTYTTSSLSFSNSNSFLAAKEGGGSVIESAGGHFYTTTVANLMTNIWPNTFLNPINVPSGASSRNSSSFGSTFQANTVYTITANDLSTALNNSQPTYSYSINNPSDGVVVIYVTGGTPITIARAIQPAAGTTGRLLFVTNSNIVFAPALGFSAPFTTADLATTVSPIVRAGFVTTGTITLDGAGANNDPSLYINGPVLAKAGISISNRSRGGLNNGYPSVIFGNSTPQYLYNLSKQEKGSGGTNANGTSTYNVTWY